MTRGNIIIVIIIIIIIIIITIAIIIVHTDFLHILSVSQIVSIDDHNC